MNQDIQLHCSVQDMANLLMSIAEGKMNSFVRSGFKRDPMEHWDTQWDEVQLLMTKPDASGA
jgi:TetR/AcrR family transcriptional regulator